MDKAASTTVMGMIPGMVMCRVCFQRFAPSEIAASYDDGLISANDVRYIIAPKPDSFQIWLITMIKRSHPPASASLKSHNCQHAFSGIGHRKRPTARWRRPRRPREKHRNLASNVFSHFACFRYRPCRFLPVTHFHIPQLVNDSTTGFRARIRSLLASLHAQPKILRILSQ